MRKFIGGVVAGWLIAGSVVQTQADWSAVQILAAGTELRVSAGSTRTTGRLQTASDSELAISRGSADVVRFDRFDVELVEVFVGEPHPKRRGALKGALWALLLAVPATVATEMGGMERKYLPALYCYIICTGAAVGAWMADDAQTKIVYRR